MAPLVTTKGCFFILKPEVHSFFDSNRFISLNFRKNWTLISELICFHFSFRCHRFKLCTFFVKTSQAHGIITVCFGVRSSCEVLIVVNQKLLVFVLAEH